MNTATRAAGAPQRVFAQWARYALSGTASRTVAGQGSGSGRGAVTAFRTGPRDGTDELRITLAPGGLAADDVFELGTLQSGTSTLLHG